MAAARARVGRRVLVGLAVGVLLAVVVRGFVVSVSVIPSASMAPTLVAGDRVLVNRLAYVLGDPARGDVVVFREASGEERVKRIEGLPGERVEVSDEGLSIDGRAVAWEAGAEVSLDEDGLPATARVGREVVLGEERLGDRAHTAVRARWWKGPRGAWTVPAGSMFVLGDNRDDSTDSRDPAVGAVARDRLAGRVWRIVDSRTAGGQERPERRWSLVR